MRRFRTEIDKKADKFGAYRCRRVGFRYTFSQGAARSYVDFGFWAPR